MAHFEIAADIAMCEHTPKVNLIAYLASSDKFYFDHYKTINFKTKYRVEGGGERGEEKVFQFFSLSDKNG